jgi:hypothetical protein
VSSDYSLDIFWFLQGYVFAEANGIVPVDIETNYPDVLSIFVVKDVNNTEEHVRFVLQVCFVSVFFSFHILLEIILVLGCQNYLFDFPDGISS